MAFSKSTTSLPPVQQCTNHRDLSFSKHPLWPYKERKYICSESTDCSLHTFNLRKCQTPLIQLQCFSFNGIYIYKLFLKVHLGITRILSVFLFWSAHWLTDWLTDWLSLLINCPNWDGLTLQGTDSTSTDGSTCIVFWLSKNFVSSPPRCRYALITLSQLSLSAYPLYIICTCVYATRTTKFLSSWLKKHSSGWWAAKKNQPRRKENLRTDSVFFLVPIQRRPSKRYQNLYIYIYKVRFPGWWKWFQLILCQLIMFTL